MEEQNHKDQVLAFATKLRVFLESEWNEETVDVVCGALALMSANILTTISVYEKIEMSVVIEGFISILSDCCDVSKHAILNYLPDHLLETLNNHNKPQD